MTRTDVTLGGIRPWAPRRRALLQSVSLSALVVAAAAPPAVAAPFRSLGQALASHPSAAVVAAQTGGGATAAATAGLGAQNFAAAANRFRSLSDALAQNTYGGAPVPNGIGAGGLEQAPGVAGSNNSTLWSGASTTLTQTLANGTTDVTVTQTGSVAALTWQSFNIGAKTNLIFNQSAGGSRASTWVAINSLTDASANPSTILGQITAPGKIFILNRNGVLFGAGSQVNVGSLIAATADIAQSQFTIGTNGLISGLNLYGAVSTTNTLTYAPSFTNASATGSIVVQPGATIATPAPTGSAGGGYVMLLAANVQNGGVISTPHGQTVLAAGNDFYIEPGYSPSGNVTSTVIGSQVAVDYGSITGSGTTALGAATNTGIIYADQGDITMVGHLVTQAGIVISTTTVNNRGTVHLLTDRTDATASVVLAPGSVTEVLPEDDGQTALNSQRSANISLSATYNVLRTTQGTNALLNDANTLPDQIGESRVEISTGGTVDVQNGALALAQGGQVAVGASNIILETGSTLDVSGTTANLPASANSLFVAGIVPYYLRDSAANRTGGLEFSNVYIDERTLVEIASGTYAGNIYTAGGLLEVGGNLGLIGHGINEWSAIGGQVILQGVANGGYSSGGSVAAAGTVTVSAGATINLTGGTVNYAAGLVPQSYVETTQGQVYNINDAPGDLVYAGVYTGVELVHSRWHITDTFNNPLLTPSEIYEPAYTIGRDAGTLTVSAGSAILNGSVDTGVTVGNAQTGARPSTVTDPFLLAQTVTPLGGAFVLGDYTGGAYGIPFLSNILVSDSATIPTGNGNGNAPEANGVPDAVAGTISIGAAAFSADGFATVTFSTAGDITIAAPITLANGGSLTLSGQTIEVGASLVAHAGAITLTNLEAVSGTIAALGTTPGSITVSSGATLDTSGEWTNLALDPGNLLLAGYAGGGNVTVQGTGGVDLQAGSVIDVSSGGVLSAAGKLTAAAGGNINVSADLVPELPTSLDSTGAITYASTFLGYASGSAGTLSLAAPQIVVGAPSSADGTTTFVAGPAFFDSGFSGYSLNGYGGLSVDPGLAVAVTRSVYVLSNPDVASGSPAAGAYTVILPGLFTQVKGQDALTQRAGASLTLASSIYPLLYDGGGGAITIGAGADLTVDPKQSISVYGYGQVTDYGTLTAHGGTITIANTRFEQALSGADHAEPANFVDGLSVWIGAGALVDASGAATVYTDAQGRRYGQAQSGGAIYLGGLGGLNEASPETTYAQIIVRPGAVLDVAGASATVDVAQGLAPASITQFHGPVTFAGNGGLIAARSYEGIAFDGTLLAGGSGAGASGGTLAMRIDPQDINSFYGIPQADIAASQILISQNTVFVQTEAGLAPGDSFDPATVSLGRISEQQLLQGGFDTLRLYAQYDIAFDGNVSLNLARSVTLESGIIGETQPFATASVTAPYVDLIGYGANAQDPSNESLPQGPTATTATLTVNAGLIDISEALDLGGFAQLADASGIASPPTGPILDTFAYTYGFAQTTFNSTGDIRFTPSTSNLDTLTSSGNITFHAAQLYPTTGAVETVIAGVDPYNYTNINQLAGGTISVQGLGGAAPQAPFSIGGTLNLFADTVLQDGIIVAPEGLIQLGKPRTSGTTDLQLTDTVLLGANSITSVSLDGLDVPYGGTVDGVNYLYDGVAVQTFNPIVAVGAVSFTADPGAEIDLRGGGTLSGAGFIAGRGGSADVNKTPLLQTATGSVTANTSDPVFAIVPGYSSEYAPVAPADTAYSAPAAGEEISIKAGEVPGLAAGTYTLLPAYYDLLPGAFRVELTGNAAAPGTSQAFGNFTTAAAVTVGDAGTDIQGSVPTAALITSAAGVRQLSQYDEENYSTFESNAAATFNAPRPLLPQDAKTLLVDLNAPLTSTMGTGTSGTGTSSTGTTSGGSAIVLDAATLLQAPAANGFGATVEITTTSSNDALEILGAQDVGTQLTSTSGTGTDLTIYVDSAILSALNAPRLVLGGTLSTSIAVPNEIIVNGISQQVDVAPHADLTAGDVIITANSGGFESSAITVQGGAIISTAGQPSTAYGLAQGYYFNSTGNNGSAPVLDVSSAQSVYVPSAVGTSASAITVGDGAVLAAGGSLNFVAPNGTSVEVGQAALTAKYVSVQVADINIGTQGDLASFAGLLPGGLALTDTTLATLAQGASQLILTAQQAVNVIGSVPLNSGTTDLVLNTPALYGYGIATTSNGATTVDPGVVSITAPSFTWGGVGIASTLQSLGGAGTTVVSAVPGGRLAGSFASNGTTQTLTDAASLAINAKTIDLGYGPDSQVNDQATLDRLVVGFTNVALQATGEITANNKSALTVYQDQAVFGQPGTGGTLSLLAPLVTAASGAVLGFTAGDTITAATPAGTAPAATGSISTLGAEIDLTATNVDISTAFALPSGKLSIDAQQNIDLAAGTNIDLSGRAVTFFDQTAESTGGTLLLQAYAGNNGNITEDAGATVNVSAPGANAGSIGVTASAGTVAFNGVLDGSAPASFAGGAFTVFAGTLATAGAGSGFDALNTSLDAGGFIGLRGFELASGNIVVDQTIHAHEVDISADAGSIDVLGTINASGVTPGSIALSANTTLTLESTAVLDAHATATAVDSYGNEIDAENRAHVTLTAGSLNGAPGLVVLDQGATINVSYPDASNPQGEVVINAPRLGSGSALTDVSVSAPGSLNIAGAKTIDLYGFITYTPTDANGTIVQDNGSSSVTSTTGTIGIVQIGAANAAYMTSVDNDGSALATQLAGLVKYGSEFNVLPGVTIQSSAASNGNLTISGDLDLSALRYSDPTSLFGIGTTTVLGSGEPGSILFRAANDLVINGSVTDGFAPPPDASSTSTLAADANGWEFLTPNGGGYEPTNSDVLLPSSALAVYHKQGSSKDKTSSEIYLIGVPNPSHLVGFTVFDTTRPISLNYAITINAANLKADVTIPFTLIVGTTSAPVPTGGWIATASVVRNNVTLFTAGQLIPAGFTFQEGDVLGAGSVLPVSVQTQGPYNHPRTGQSYAGQVIPAGTPFSIFSDSTISLSADVLLQANDLIPAFTDAVFGGVFKGVNGGLPQAVTELEYRASQTIDGVSGVQGFLYPLAQMLPAGSLSWSMDFVAGANLAGASANAVLPTSTLQSGVFTPPVDTPDQALGSLLIDDQHYYINGTSIEEQKGDYPVLAFSVIRTGAGDLSLVAGGDTDVSSLYGIYTAGTQDPLGNGQDAQFNSARQNEGTKGLLPGKDTTASQLISSTYQAYYPNGGGDVLFAAQGNVTGYVAGGDIAANQLASDNVGNWLWRQGSTQLDQPTSWWINFGTLVAPLGVSGTTSGSGFDAVQMTGFTGIGALGGGNVTVSIGGDAGQMTDRDEGGVGAGFTAPFVSGGEGLVVAVGGTGRLLPGDSTPVTTGGGDINITIGGALNPIDAAAYGLGATSSNLNTTEPASVNGEITDIRGDIAITAGAIGRIDYAFDSGTGNINDPRAVDPFTANDGTPNGGITVVPGDGTVSITTDRDLVLNGAADPGRVVEQSVTNLGDLGTAMNAGGDTGFTLWQPTTAISLFSDGGNVTPTSLPNQGTGQPVLDGAPTDYRSIYPAILLVTAATGDIIYGQNDLTPANANASNYLAYSLETMPAANGQVSFLAGGSIYANGYAVDISGADPAGLSLPTDPAFTSDGAVATGAVTNIRTGIGTNQSPLALFALEADTPTTDLHESDPQPARFYAADGDIVDFQSGETLYFGSSSNEPQSSWYIAGKPVWIIASNDIVSTGTRPGAYPDASVFGVQENQQAENFTGANGNLLYYSSGNLFFNTSPQSTSMIKAGRDILSAYAYVGGPGTLDVIAGRNLYQAAYSVGLTNVLEFGSFKSLGDNLITGSLLSSTAGAGIDVLAGVGSAGPDYSALADLFFNPANQGKIDIPDPVAAHKAADEQVFTNLLLDMLTKNYGYTGGAAGAYAFLSSLPQGEQTSITQTLFYAVLQYSGAQEANPNSIYYKSYGLGRQAIDTLFPSMGTEAVKGAPSGYTGTITMYSGTLSSVTTPSGAAATFDGGVATLFGGSVQVLDPGGAAVFGITGGPAPGNSSGIVTYGAGDVDIYTLGNVLLGQSRIFTTGGGNIVIWSSVGDINAGIGAKTTVVYNPPVLVYDDLGDVTETPPASTSGAGIATLQPLPDVAAGDVNLIAPGGTIDAGEAGIRVSGNLLLAASRVVGAANISVKGSTSGAPTVASVSLSAAEAGNAVAGSSQVAGQTANQNNVEHDVASIIDVEVVSVGGTYDEEQKRRKKGL